jgi:hypothetical protein
MSKYSFLLETKEEGFVELLPGLRLKKFGGWLVAEAIEQEEIGKLQSQATIRAVQLAKKVAAAKGVGLDEAFTLLQSGGSSLSEAELLSEFTEETLSMLTSGSSVEATNARMVTAFIRSRGQGLIDGAWQDVSDWSSEDTSALPRKIVAKVVEFIAAEQEAEMKGAGEAKKAPKRNSPPSQND